MSEFDNFFFFFFVWKLILRFVCFLAVLSPREKLNSNSVVVSVKPRLQGLGAAPHPPRYNSQNLVEEWLQKMPTTLPTIAEKLPVVSRDHSGSESTALNLSMQSASKSKSSTCSSQYSKLPNSSNQNNGAFNLHSTPNMDSNKSRAIRDIQLAHTKDMHGN